MIYTMIWVEEEEKWHYLTKDFVSTQFKDGYVDYYVNVEDGLILSDSYCQANVGKSFHQCYDITLWVA